MKKFKPGMTFIIVVMVLFSSMGLTFAFEQSIPAGVNGNPITPNWVGLNTITNDFQILSGGLANPTIRGTTYSGAVDYVNVSVSLKRSNGSSWTTIKSWNQNITISLNRFTFDETYSVFSGYSYKYSATVKSYKNGLLLDSVSFDSKALAY